MVTRIYVDFNSPYGSERVPIDFERSLLGITGLASGMPVILYCEEMEVDAILEYDSSLEYWFGIPDWKSRRFFEKK